MPRRPTQRRRSNLDTKTLSCDLCDMELSAVSFEGWLEQMKGHDMSDHADFMAATAGKLKEEGMKWMADMKA